MQKMHKCTNAQMLKCSNAQMHKCTNAQMHKCTNANANCTNAIANCTNAAHQKQKAVPQDPYSTPAEQAVVAMPVEDQQDDHEHPQQLSVETGERIGEISTIGPAADSSGLMGDKVLDRVKAVHCADESPGFGDSFDGDDCCDRCVCVCFAKQRQRQQTKRGVCTCKLRCGGRQDTHESGIAYCSNTFHTMASPSSSAAATTTTTHTSTTPKTF